MNCVILTNVTLDIPSDSYHLMQYKSFSASLSCCLALAVVCKSILGKPLENKNSNLAIVPSFENVNNDRDNISESSQKITLFSKASSSELPALISSYVTVEEDGRVIVCLKHCDINHRNVESIIKQIKSLSINPNSFVFDFNPIGNSGLQLILGALKDLHETQSLSVRFCGMSSTGCRTVASVLLKAEKYDPPGKLTHLSLSGNDIGADGAKYLAAALKKDVCLERLELSHCNIDDNGAIQIAQALISNKCLKFLDLSYNKIGSEGAYMLSKVLCKRGMSIEKLNLSNNTIKDDGAIALASALTPEKQNSKARNSSGILFQPSEIQLQLDVSSNRIGPKGCAAFASALAKNCRLTHLDISDNSPFENLSKGSKNSSHLRKHAKDVASTISKMYKQFLNESDVPMQQRTIGESSMSAFCRAFKKNSNLKYIGLAQTGMDQRTARRLGKSMEKNSKLQHVDLLFNPKLSVEDLNFVKTVIEMREKES